MDKDHPSITISEEEDEFLKDAFDEQLEPEEEKKSIWRRIVVVIIIILLLLLLFWPVAPAQIKQLKRRARARQASQAGVVGATEYTVLSAKPMPELDNRPIKAIPVGVWFKVKNLSSRSAALDYSMAKLVDSGGNESQISAELIEKQYSESKSESPWEKPVGAGRVVKAMAVFYVFRAPEKNYQLRGRDFDWTSDRYTDLPVGTFSTLGK